MIKPLLILASLVFTAPAFAQTKETVSFNANKACAELVGIPYASDNFTDEEWVRFKQCLQVMHYFDSKY